MKKKKQRKWKKNNADVDVHCFGKLSEASLLALSWLLQILGI